MTFKQLVNSLDLNALYSELSTFYKVRTGKDCTDEQTAHNYNELINKVKNSESSKDVMPIEVSWTKDYIEPYVEYINVCMVNPNYIEPPKNCKPWGGEDHPEGYYNVNDNKYNRNFTLSLPWSELANAEVINPANLSDVGLAAEICWECTWYSMTEAGRDEFFEELNQDYEDIKSGKTKGVEYKSIGEMMKDIFGDVTDED